MTDGSNKLSYSNKFFSSLGSMSDSDEERVPASSVHLSRSPTKRLDTHLRAHLAHLIMRSGVAWLCVQACAAQYMTIPSPRAAKPVVDAGDLRRRTAARLDELPEDLPRPRRPAARDGAAETMERKLASEPEFQLPEFRKTCANDDSTTDRYGDTCTQYYDALVESRAEACSGVWDDKDFKAKKQCCACGGGEGTFAPTVSPKPTVMPTAAPTGYYDGVHHTDTTIREAVAAWFANATAAEAMYGPIATWETGKVTDMSMLFCVKKDWMDDPGQDTFKNCVLTDPTFNEDISAWDNSRVTTMWLTFYGAASFDQPIGAWNVDNVVDISWMFKRASSFNQPLDGWNVGAVTDMRHVFYQASSFNQFIGDWNVDQVTNMNSIFRGATAFDQDLGWCFELGVIDNAFLGTKCVATSCSVLSGDSACAPTSAPTLLPAPTRSPTPEAKPHGNKKKSSNKLSTGEIVAIVVGCLFAFLLCVLGCLLYKQRERKHSERKESWDMTTMFPADAEAPPDEPATDWAAETPADSAVKEPAELQKITQAAEL